jgi:hypothetical protein
VLVDKTQQLADLNFSYSASQATSNDTTHIPPQLSDLFISNFNQIQKIAVLQIKQDHEIATLYFEQE